MRFKVLMATSVKTTAFWDTAPCRLVEVDRRFRDAYCLHHRSSNDGDSKLQHLHQVPGEGVTGTDGGGGVVTQCNVPVHRRHDLKQQAIRNSYRNSIYLIG
jgi:hypothetical protein